MLNSDAQPPPRPLPFLLALGICGGRGEVRSRRIASRVNCGACFRACVLFWGLKSGTCRLKTRGQRKSETSCGELWGTAVFKDRARRTYVIHCYRILVAESRVFKFCSALARLARQCCQPCFIRTASLVPQSWVQRYKVSICEIHLLQSKLVYICCKIR